MSNGLHHQKSETEGKWNDSSPSSLLLFSSLYSVLPAIHQPVSPLARSLPSPLTPAPPPPNSRLLSRPTSARRKGPRRSLRAGEWRDEAAGEGVRGQRECCIWNAKCNTAWGVGVGRWGGCGVTLNIQWCVVVSRTRGQVVPRVLHQSGFNLLIIRFVFVAATEEKCQKWTFQHLWRSIHLSSTLSTHLAHGCEMVMSPPARLSSLCRRVPRCRTPPLPAPAHPFCRPPSRLTGSDFLHCASLSIVLFARKPRTAYLSLCAYFVPSCLLPLPHLLLINFILWLPGCLAPSPSPASPLLPSLPSSTLCPPFSCRLPSIFL